MSVRIINGDCREALRSLPEASVNCCVTSPPYYWLRDYGVEGQIGHEPDVAAFVGVLGDVFDEVKRVLADDGVLWLNLNDSFYSGNGQPHGSDPKCSSRNFRRNKKSPLDVGGWDIPKKSLLGIPWLVAHELQRRQWTIRCDVIWDRPTALAEPSVTDRPGRQHEYLFLLSKSRRYSFNRAMLPEQSVWRIPHERGNKDHNAAFPEELARRCIVTGSASGGTVLDPFAGSGTVGVVAQREKRHAILIELNPQFVEVAEARVRADAPLLAATA